MSHYRVGVIAKYYEDVNGILYPYDESLEVEPYLKTTRLEATKSGKEKYFDLVEKAKDDKNAKNVLEDVFKRSPELKDLTLDSPDELFYQFYVRHLVCWPPELIAENGDLYSTYNKKSKFDYYSDGDGATLFEDGVSPKEALKKFNELVTIEGDKIKIKDEYYDYFPYAMCDDRDWYAPGKVGWFGCDDSTEDSFDRYILKLKEVLEYYALKEGYGIYFMDLHI